MRLIVKRSLENAIGLKLRGSSSAFANDSLLLLVWEDGTHTLVKGDTNYDGGISVYSTTEDMQVGDFSRDDLVKSTLLTEAEVLQLKQELEQSRVEAIRARDLREYRRLKKMFTEEEPRDPKLLS